MLTATCYADKDCQQKAGRNQTALEVLQSAGRGRGRALGAGRGGGRGSGQPVNAEVTQGDERDCTLTGDRNNCTVPGWMVCLGQHRGLPGNQVQVARRRGAWIQADDTHCKTPSKVKEAIPEDGAVGERSSGK